MQSFSVVARHGSAMELEMKKNKEEMLCSYHFREYVICCIHGSYLLVCFVAMIVLTIRTKLQTMPESLLLILKTYRGKIKKLIIEISNNRGSNNTWLNQTCK